MEFVSSESQCKAGQEAAKGEKNCSPTSNKPGAENYKVYFI